MLDKREIRKKVEDLRAVLEIEEKEKKDQIIYNELLNKKSYLDAQKIFIYVSMGNEVDTRRIIDSSLKQGKKIYVPKVDKKNKFMKVIELRNLNDLEGVPPYNILEPKDDSLEIDPRELDLVIVPGVAFTEKGERIGYGGGYYDRFLQRYNKIYTIVLAYEFQIFREVPVEAHDQKVRYIITDERNIIV